MVSLDHLDLAAPAPPIGRVWVWPESPLAIRAARGLALALAAVLIPGMAARFDGSPASR